MFGDEIEIGSVVRYKGEDKFFVLLGKWENFYWLVERVAALGQSCQFFTADSYQIEQVNLCSQCGQVCS